MSRWRQRLLAFGVVISLFLLVAHYFSGLFLPASPTPLVVRVEIPVKAATSQIADLLSARGVIRSKHAFVVSARVLGLAKSLKAGDYELDAHQGLLQILDKISRGDAVANWVTIPEGYTVTQIADLLAKQRMANARSFLDLTTTEGQEYLDVPIPRPGLEGYLLPDSYKFKTGVNEKDIVQGICQNFERQVVTGLKSDLQSSGRTLDEMVIIASLIEREARIPGDRDRISAVIRNRLQRKMRLQIDATVIYALGSHRKRLSLKDTRIDHPYNTYKHEGLPPGPICNPGLACLKAALHPADVPFLYYVARDDGSHYFSTTYKEHQQHGGT